MRRHHISGEKMFVDYADQTVAVVDAKSGEVLPVIGAVRQNLGAENELAAFARSLVVAMEVLTPNT